MKINRNEVPSVPPSNGNGSKVDKQPVFSKPEARHLPLQAKPPADAKTIQLAVSVPQKGLGWLYQILVNFMRVDQGGKNG